MTGSINTRGKQDGIEIRRWPGDPTPDETAIRILDNTKMGIGRLSLNTKYETSETVPIR